MADETIVVQVIDGVRCRACNSLTAVSVHTECAWLTVCWDCRAINGRTPRPEPEPVGADNLVGPWDEADDVGW